MAIDARPHRLRDLHVPIKKDETCLFHALALESQVDVP